MRALKYDICNMYRTRTLTYDIYNIYRTRALMYDIYNIYPTMAMAKPPNLNSPISWFSDKIAKFFARQYFGVYGSSTVLVGLFHPIIQCLPTSVFSLYTGGQCA